MFRLAASRSAKPSGGDELDISQIDRPAVDFAGRAIRGNQDALLGIGTEISATSETGGRS
jgi:hypothetical protein